MNGFAWTDTQTHSYRWNTHSPTNTIGISCSLGWRDRLNLVCVIWGLKSKSNTHHFSSSLPFSVLHFLPTSWPFLPMCSKSFSTSEQSHDKLSKYCNVITRTPCFVFLPLTHSTTPFPHFFFPRGSKWGQIFLFLLCNLNRVMILVAAYRAGRNS